MNEDKYVAKMPQSLVLEDRRRLALTGVEDVDSFDDKTVVIKTVQGRLTIYGEGLKMGKFNVATGELSLEGNVAAMCYADGGRKGGRLAKVFR